MPVLTAQGVSAPLVIVNGSVNWGAETQDTILANQGHVFPGVPANSPTNRIITNDQAINLNVNFTAQGALMGLLVGGNWVMQLHLECFGPSESTLISPILLPVVPLSSPQTYSATVQFPIGLPAALYRCAFTLTLQDASSDPIPTGAFADMGNILVLED